MQHAQLLARPLLAGIAVLGLTFSPSDAQAKAEEDIVRIDIEIDRANERKRTITLSVPVDGELEGPAGSIDGRAISCEASVREREAAEGQVFHTTVKCGYGKDPDELFELEGRAKLDGKRPKTLGSIEALDGSKVRVRLRLGATR